MRVGQSSR